MAERGPMQESISIQSDSLGLQWLRSLRSRPLIYARMLTLSQVVADLLTVVGCFTLSYAVYTRVLQKTSPQPLFHFGLLTTASALIYAIVLERFGLYRREMSLLNIRELRGVCKSGIVAAAAILSINFYMRVDLSRITLTLCFTVTPLALYLNRLAFYRLHLWIHQKGWAQTRVLIFGAGNIGRHLAKRLFESPTLGLLPLGFLDDDSSKHGTRVRWTGIGPREGLPVFGGEQWLRDNLGRVRADMLMISLPSATFDRNQQLVEYCVDHKVDYAIVPNAYEPYIQRMEISELGGIPLLQRKRERVSLSYLAIKRVLDFLTSSLLLTLLSPLFLIFYFLIKIDSRGPVIFKQKRVGLKGKEFSFYKFRTMRIDADRYARSPNDPNDPRITRLGRWLRRTSLDELPQLFNVWRGDMSMVGPRPEMPFIVATYTPLERRRLEAKPGITGVWQISAVRGEPIHANLEYDLFYLENRSLLLDFAIVVKTAFSVIRGIGAV